MVAQRLAVEPDITGRLHPAEMQEQRPLRPVRRDGEGSAVEARGVGVGGNPRWRGLEGMLNVGKNRPVVGPLFPGPDHLPVGGHGQVVPGSGGGGQLEKIGGNLGRVRYPLEFPGAVQRFDER